MSLEKCIIMFLSMLLYIGIYECMHQAAWQLA